MTRTPTADARRTADILAGALAAQLTRRRVHDAQIELRTRSDHLEVAVSITPDSEVLAQVPTRHTGGIRVALDTSSTHLRRADRHTTSPAAAATAMANVIVYVLSTTYPRSAGHRRTA